MSESFSKIAPSERSVRPRIVRSSVVLPTPLRPMIVTTLFPAASRLSRCSTWLRP